MQEIDVFKVSAGTKYFHMLHKFERVTHLHLDNVDMLNASDLKAIASGLPNLQSLEITNCYMVISFFLFIKLQ